MKPSTSVKTFLYLLLALFGVTSVGCGPNFGEKIVVKGTEIYYKDGATKADAERLGKKLEQMEFADGKSKSVQLLKRGSVWEFRMATAKMKEDEASKGPLKLYALQFSSAFDGDEVEVHVCNQKLESRSVVKGLRGKLYTYKKNQYFYKDVDLKQVKKFAAIAYATELDTGNGFNYHLSQPSTSVEIRMAYPRSVKGDRRLAVAATSAAVAASKNVFGGKPVDVLIGNLFFTTQATFSSTQKAANSKATATQ